MFTKDSNSSFYLRLAGFALAYWAGAEMVYATPGDFADFWLPSGIYLAVLLRTPPRRWWAVCVAAGAANFLADVMVHGQSWRLGAGYVLLNVGLPPAGAALLVRWCRPAFSLARLPHVLLWGLGISVINALFSALGGAALKVILRGGDFGQKWQLWWIGDLVGMLVALPLTLGVIDWSSGRPARRVRESAALLLCAGPATWWLFGLPYPPVIPSAVLYLFLLWAALRLGATGVAATALLMLSISLWLTAAGLGPFSLMPAMQARMLTVQLLFAVGAFSFYILAAVVAERRVAESELQQSNVKLEQDVRARTEELRGSNALLQAILAGTTDLVWVKDAEGRITLGNQATYDLLGAGDAGRVLGRGADELMPAPEHARQVKDNEARVMAQGVTETVEEEFGNPSQPLIFQSVKAPLRDAAGQVVGVIGVSRDITEQKRTEAALRASEERFAKAFNASPTAITLTSLRTGRLLEVNDTFERALGFTRAEAVGKTTAELGLWEPATRAAELAALQAQGQLRDVEYKFRTRDGVEVIGLLSAELLELNGEPCALTVVQDITARKQAEAKLRESEERLQLALASADTGIHVWDIAADTLHWDDRLRELWSIGPDEAVSYAVFERGLHPDDRAATQAAVDRALDPASDGRFTAECRVIGKNDGVTRWIHATGQVFFENGQPQRLIGTARDISERKQAETALRESEHRYRSLVEVTSAVTWSCPPDGLQVEPQPSWMAFTGQSAEEMLGAGWNKALHPDDAAAVGAQWAEAVAHGEPFTTEFRIRRHDGEWRWMHVQAAPARNERGEITEWFGMNFDITERKQAEAALRANQQRLTRAQSVGRMGWWQLDVRQNVLAWSEETYRIFGLAVGAPLTYETFLACVHADDRAYVDAQWQAALGGASYDIEHRIVAGGQIKWVREKAFLEFDNGELSGGFGIAQDITERKRQEERLRASERRFRGIFNHQFQFSALLTPDGKIVEISESAMRTAGIPAAEVAGKPFLEMVWWQDMPERRAQWQAQFDAALAHGVAARDEAPYRLPDGSLRYAFSTATVLRDENGTPEFLLVEGVDITERKEAEARIQQSEERFRLASDAARAMVYDVDYQTPEETVAVYGCAALLGAEPPAPVTRAWYATQIHPDDLPLVKETVACAADGAEYVVQYRLRHADGHYLHVEDRGRMLLDAAGHVVRGIGTTQDITERKQHELNLAFLADLHTELAHLTTAEEVMTTACERLTAHLGLAHCLFVEIDHTARTAYVRYDAHAATARDLAGAYDLQQFHTEAERGVLMAGRAVVIPNVRGGGRDEAAATAFEALGIRALVTLPYLSNQRWTFALSAQKDAPYDWRADECELLQELTTRLYLRVERARAEKHARLALESGGMAAWVWYLPEDRVEIDDNYCALWGLAKEDYQGDALIFLDRILPADRPIMQNALDDAIKNGTPYRAEFRIALPDGQIRWLAGFGRTEYDANGRPLSMRGVNFDITARKELEAEREQLLLREQHARQLAEDANRAKDNWLAMVTHELRSPLNAILGHARLLNLRRAQLAPEFNEFAEMVRRNGERQNELINDLLDTARAATGKLQLVPGAVEPVGVVLDALDSVRPAALARQVALLTDLDAELGALTGDAARLQQVVWNLLTNAVKFTPAGGSVQVSLRRDEENVVLAVRDTGQGIAPDFLPHVFERFSQADTSRSRRHGGLGLGLALVKQIVELHGGTITAASEGVGCGAVFTVRLPVRVNGSDGISTEKPVEPNHPVVPATPFPSLIPSLNGVSILVIEDDPDARVLVTSLLSGQGATTLTAATAAEAWPLLTDEARPQMVICDIGLPQEDGYSLLQRLRRWEKAQAQAALPALALTALSGVHDRLQALQAGFQTHVAKPVDPEELLLVLQSLRERGQLAGARFR